MTEHPSEPGSVARGRIAATAARSLASAAPGAVVSLDDPRALQILSTEHWSLLSARSLAFNEAFVRGGMFLTFLSMSFVALALLAQGVKFGTEFLAVTAVVLAFDVVVGLTTYARIIGANFDDLRAVHGMARIRHAYTEIAPIAEPYFTTPTHDDAASVMSAYGMIPSSRVGTVFYGFTTSGGMIGLITAMVGGVLVADLALIAGLSGGPSVVAGVAGGTAMLLLLVAFTFGSVPRHQTSLPVGFPAPAGPRTNDPGTAAG
jgi:hypothetical protein